MFPYRYHRQSKRSETRYLVSYDFRRARASVLVGLLWCLALLSLMVVGTLHVSRMDLRVGKNYGDRIQAHYLALAGIEKAKALLYQDAKERTRNGKNHSGELYSDAQHFRDVKLGNGIFRVFRRAQPNEGGGVIYGITDEESRLNVNTASDAELGKIQGMTPDIVAAIMDWRDADNTVSPGGAEAEYYTALQPPYQPRNGPFQTIRELLMVRGVNRRLLFGENAQKNPDLDARADQEDDQSTASIKTGWASFLTVNSMVDNVSATGSDRVDVQNADEAALTAVKGITSQIAKAIVSYRGQNRLNSVADLLDVVAAQNENQTGLTTGANRPGSTRTQGSSRTTSPNQPGAASTGTKVISENLLMDIADELTAQSGQNAAGPVNVNTASLEVLACLPGVDRELAQAIISFRQSNGFFPNVAWLLKVPGMPRETFKQLAARVCVRSETFCILSEGKVNSTGSRQRIQEIVHMGLNTVKTLAYREDDL